MKIIYILVLLLVITNAIAAYAAYKNKKYVDSITYAFSCGFIAGALLMALLLKY